MFLIKVIAVILSKILFSGFHAYNYITITGISCVATIYFLILIMLCLFLTTYHSHPIYES